MSITSLPTNTERQLLTTAEVAAMTGVSEATLRYWRANRALPGEDRETGPRSFNLGRVVRYKAEDVQSWIDARYNAGAVES